MYASMMQGNAALMSSGGGASWITNSAVVHAVSSTPGGPYTATDIALGPRGKIIRAATPHGCSNPNPAGGHAQVDQINKNTNKSKTDTLLDQGSPPLPPPTLVDQAPPAVVCPVVEANQYWDAVTVCGTHQVHNLAFRSCL